MSGTNPEAVGRGVLTAAISNALVGLLHRYTGRGPTRARTTIDQDMIVCVMGATLTKGEQSLVQDGKAEVVLHSRRAFQETMQADAIAAVEELSGRHVVAFMSNNNIDPDLAVEVFVLEPQLDGSFDGSEPGRDGHKVQIDGDGHNPAASHDGRDGQDGHISS